MHKQLKLLVVVVTMATTVFYLFKSGWEILPFNGDSLGYYSYLPAAFIYHHPIDHGYVPENMGIDEHTKICLRDPARGKTPTGHDNNQYTMGVAIFDAPFFFIAHAWEYIIGGKANGYTWRYELLLRLSSVFYSIMGLWFSYRALRKYYSDLLAAITLAVIFLGSNLIFFTISQAGMSHNILFMLYAMVLWYTIQLYDTERPGYFIYVALTCGFITLIRPTDAISVLIPALYGLYSGPTFRKRFSFLGRHIAWVALAAVLAVIPFTFQMLYWHAAAGQWLYYSYQNQWFQWLAPRIGWGLFYDHNGWLNYNPVMGFSLLGVLLFRRNKQWALATWVVILLYIYIIYSWYCYNYINGYGSRPMIHMYPLLALPMAAIFGAIGELKGKLGSAIKVFTTVLVLLLITYNLNLALLQSRRMLESEYSNYIYNFNMLFKLEPTYADLNIYDTHESQPDPSKLTKVATLYAQDYEHVTDPEVLKGVVKLDSAGNHGYHTGDMEYPPQFAEIKYSKALFGDAKWVKASGRFMYPVSPDYFKHLLVVHFDPYKYVKTRLENKIGMLDGYYDDKRINLEQFVTNRWGEAYFFTRIPEGMAEGTPVKFSMWNIGKREIYMDDIKLELYK